LCWEILSYYYQHMRYEICALQCKTMRTANSLQDQLLPNKNKRFCSFRRYANTKYFLWKRNLYMCNDICLWISEITKSRNGLIHFIHHTKSRMLCMADGIQASVLNVPFPINITSLNNSTQKRHSGSWISRERTKYRLSNLLLEGWIAILSVTLTGFHTVPWADFVQTYKLIRIIS